MLFLGVLVDSCLLTDGLDLRLLLPLPELAGPALLAAGALFCVDVFDVPLCAATAGAGEEDVGGQKAHVVVPDVGPDNEVSALEEGACRKDGHDEDARVEGWSMCC